MGMLVSHLRRWGLFREFSRAFRAGLSSAAPVVLSWWRGGVHSGVDAWASWGAASSAPTMACAWLFYQAAGDKYKVKGNG